MNDRLRQCLEDRGVGVDIRGQKGTRYRELAKDLEKSRPEEKTRIFTKHGARLVLQAKDGGRLSYKQLLGWLLQEAEHVIAEMETAHTKQLEYVIEQARLVGADVDPNGHEAITATASASEETEAQ